MDDELRLRILRLLAERPEMSQRELAQALGLSLGKTNYCLRALIDRGWVKVNNFRTSQNKLAYAYVLTSKGLQAKLSAAARFLKSRQAEFVRLEREIAELRDELGDQQGGQSRSGAHR
ncbi:MarR family EPS-associated transcriptional regulator [Thermomonas carbonis]|uniref:MarR family EPS-associated transcriptional regulator n=1 Tax=Thermomonas carbonis TaxID=1463158 RepID=A0A7G9SN27_9GAMM|nr:MarR family EPS-associated transcriptional regulator [Thermomonas carbonis]QNN69252.1 MarR family EPS-associated transcriptional regulator [Thermomonas carbonis]